MNMIEKVARAIFASEGMVYTDDERMFEPYPYDELDEIEKASFEHKAKAAIEAMREPSSWMLNEAVQIYEDQAGSVSGFEYWQRMIDAALEDHN